MQAYVRAVSAMSRLGALAAMALFAASIVVVCQMIIVRYVLNGSTIWQTEFVIYALIAATMLGAAYVLTLNGHVAVDLVPEALGGLPARILRLTGMLVSLAFLVLLGLSGWFFFEEAWRGGWKTETVWAVRLWIPLLPLPVGIALLCLQYIAEIIKLFQGDRR